MPAHKESEKKGMKIRWRAAEQKVKSEGIEERLKVATYASSEEFREKINKFSVSVDNQAQTESAAFFLHFLF